MKSSTRFSNASYDAHAKHYKKYTDGGDKREKALAWSCKNTVNAWRMSRFESWIAPVIAAFPASNWVTVGDGRYGSEAQYLISNGCRAHATDISDLLLKEAAESGMIEKWSRENAECLSFSDESFDFALCKESYHHFPRPAMALYELLRVAKQGVVLIEPNDDRAYYTLRHSSLRAIKNCWRKLIRRDIQAPHAFEPVGNYIFSVSQREMEKVALGVGLSTIAVGFMNDEWIDGVEFEPMSQDSPTFRKIKATIRRRDLLHKAGIRPPDVIAVILFKVAPVAAFQQQLIGAGYRIVNLPSNPYLRA